VQDFGPAVMVQGQGVIDILFLISKGIRGAERDGYPTGRFREHLRIFRRAWEFQPAVPMSPTRRCRVAKPVNLRNCNGDEPELSTADAAELSGYSQRHCQRLARSGLGRRVGRTWLLDRAGLIAHIAATRKDDHDRAAAA
jgi:hypothetical protein